MDVPGVISRMHFTWQCFRHAKKTVQSATSLNKIPLFSRVASYPYSINTIVAAPLSLKAAVPASCQIRRYTTSATISSDKQEDTVSPPSTVPSPPEETTPKADREQLLEESPRLETSSASESVEPPSTGQEPESDKNVPLDKLYKAIELEVLAYEPSVLDSYQWFVLTAATHLGIQVGKCWQPPGPDKMRFNLLKSAFVHKKHQVHYEVRTHHRFLTFNKLTSSTADTFLEYIERNLPEGVGLKVTRIEAKPLPDFLQAE